MSSSTVETREALATHVEVSDDTVSVDLADGRTIAAPLAWYPRLAHASAEERRSWRLLGGGRGIHWPALDEDISVANLLAGQPSAESQSSFKKWLAGRAKPSRSRRKRSGAEPALQQTGHANEGESRGRGGHRLETGRLETGTQLVCHTHLANSSCVPVSTFRGELRRADEEAAGLLYPTEPRSLGPQGRQQWDQWLKTEFHRGP